MALNRSYALDVVWQFAAEEAVNAGSDFIEPAHFLLGICSIEKLFSADSASMKVTQYSLASIRAEWQDVLALLLNARLTPSTLRHELRPLLPRGHAAPGTPRTVNRSGSSRACFGRAEKSAAEAGSTLVGLVYVLDALLREAPVADMLRPRTPDFPAFQANVALAARRPLQAQPAVAEKASTSASMLGQDISSLRKRMGS